MKPRKKNLTIRYMNSRMHALNSTNIPPGLNTDTADEMISSQPESRAPNLSPDEHLFLLHLNDLKTVPDLYSIFKEEPSICSLELKFSTSFSSSEDPGTRRGLDSKAANMLVDCFPISQCLIHLSLPGNNITDDIIRDLYPGLLQCFQLVELNLSYNYISDTGARLLSTLLREEYCITSLDLSHNHIGSIGCSHIAFSLKTALCLTDIDLSVNRIPDKGAIDLFSCLGEHKIAESVNLSCNRLTDRCLPALRDLLTSNETLKRVDLSGNNIEQICWVSKDCRLDSRDCMIKDAMFRLRVP